MPPGNVQALPLETCRSGRDELFRDVKRSRHRAWHFHNSLDSTGASLASYLSLVGTQAHYSRLYHCCVYQSETQPPHLQPGRRRWTRRLHFTLRNPCIPFNALVGQPVRCVVPQEYTAPSSTQDRICGRKDIGCAFRFAVPCRRRRCSDNALPLMSVCSCMMITSKKSSDRNLGFRVII